MTFTLNKSTVQTTTPIDLLRLPDEAALEKAFVGKHISTLRTPAIILDRDIFRANCEAMAASSASKGFTFRAHVKTHKATKGVRMQLKAGNGCTAVVCSTMMECWKLVEDGLVADGSIRDMLYGLPCGLDKIDDLRALEEVLAGHGAILRLMVDHPDQIRALADHLPPSGPSWSVFVKVDGGGKRAGLPAKSAAMRELLSLILTTDAVEIYGFYSHFGQSYASSSPEEAAEYLAGEVACVSSAAQVALDLGAQPRNPYILSVGATPTAHAVDTLEATKVPGIIELHAGNYCCLDLQQYATKMIPLDKVATSVLTHVISSYPHREEAMCDAGGIAMARDGGPLAGYGHVVWPESASGWSLGRMSQEHGTLVKREDATKVQDLALGQMLRIVGQHACVTLAAHPWYYCVDGGGEIVTDVWVPWKGW